MKYDSLVAQTVRRLPAMRETRIQSLGWNGRVWEAIVHEVAKSWTGLSDFTVIFIKYKSAFFLLLLSLSVTWLFAAPWTAACQASLSFTISWNLLKLMSIEWMMLANHFVLCHPPLLFLLSVFPSIRVISNESALHHQVAKVLELQL